MELLFSTKTFKVAGVPIEGFPLFVPKGGKSIEAVFHFFLEHLLQRGTTRSQQTWRCYAYAMKDFLKFCEEQNRAWNEAPAKLNPSVISAYRNYAINQGRQSPTTINARLDLLVAFYRFAKKRSYIQALPFDLEERRVQVAEWAENTRHTARWTIAAVPSVKLKTPRTILKVLSFAQAQQFLDAFGANRTHQLMAEVQLATGIRVEELVTLPVSCIVDPRDFRDVRHWFTVELNPLVMATKGSVARTIHVPRRLMEELWAYAAVARPKRVNRDSAEVKNLFLTEQGTAYRTRSVWGIYSAASKAIGTHVNPHMLRHTYATHTLAALARSRNIGNALLYVRDRLGHASIKTTERYLHYIEDAALSINDKYQAELDSDIAELMAGYH